MGVTVNPRNISVGNAVILFINNRKNSYNILPLGMSKNIQVTRMLFLPSRNCS